MSAHRSGCCHQCRPKSAGRKRCSAEDLILTELDDMSMDVLYLRKENRDLSFNLEESEASVERLALELETVRTQHKLWGRLLAENQGTLLRMTNANKRLEEENDALWKALRQSSQAHVEGIRDNIENLKRTYRA